MEEVPRTLRNTDILLIGDHLPNLRLVGTISECPLFAWPWVNISSNPPNIPLRWPVPPHFRWQGWGSQGEELC